MSTPWTKLEGTLIWDLAQFTQNADERRVYHVFAHPRRLYHHAAHTFGFDYDADLDLAILTHDVIVDEHGSLEDRSMAWLALHSPVGTAVAQDHIARTKAHVPGADNRMILLDLADFLDEKCRIANLDLLRLEAYRMHGQGAAEFHKASLAYLGGLRSRLSAGLPDVVRQTDRDAHRQIVTGIDATMDEIRFRLDQA